MREIPLGNSGITLLCLATIPSGFEINDIDVWTKPVCYNVAACLTCYGSALGLSFVSSVTAKNLLLENLALRQQLTVLKRKQRKPRLALLDKLFLGQRSPTLAGLEELAPAGHSRNCDPVASCWIQAVLDHALQSAKEGSGKEAFQRGQ
jgi:hypothetical protein